MTGKKQGSSMEIEKADVTLRTARGERICVARDVPLSGSIVSTLVEKVEQEFGWHRSVVRLVHGGRILWQPSLSSSPAAASTVGGAGIGRVPIVYVVPLPMAVDRVAPTTAPLLRDANDEGEDDDDEPCCRICLSTESDPTGADRLFRPCLCQGTMAYVHVGCLNAWRSRSRNSSAFFRCEQCHFEYNIQRSRWSHALTSERTIRSLAAVLLICLIAASGVLVRAFDLAGKFFDFIEWREPWREWDRIGPFLDVFAGGFLAVGCCSFICSQIPVVMRMVETQDVRGLVFFGFTVSANSNRIWRVFSLLGLSYAYYWIFHRVSVFAKEALFYLGDVILEVRK